MSSPSLYPDAIARAAIHYWGEPNRALSRQTELRFGSHGSKSVDLCKGTWFDHELNEGGGVADLVKREEPGVSVVDRLQEFGLPRNSKPLKRERVWDYTDENGDIRYQVIRIDEAAGKTYRQRRVGANGDFTWGMQGVTALPYRLPDFLSNTQPIFIVEGEKCADAVINLGLVATTNHGGAGKWWPPLVPFFEDRHVIILPDNDEPGEKHARIVADALRGIARSIRILRLPGLKHKGDVVDWISAGGTRAELIQLAKAAPRCDLAELPPADDNSEIVGCDRPARIELVPWDGLTEVPVRWLVQDLLPARGFCALYGKPGSYKSFVALYVAAMVGAGLPAFGKETQKGDVVYVAGEGGAGLKARRDALVKTYGLDRTAVHFVQAQLDLRSTDADRSALVSVIQAAGIMPSLIILDTLSRAFAGGNENSSEDMGAFIRQIGALQQDLDAAVLVIHHSGKDEARGQRGHSSLLGAVDCELEVVKITDETNGDRAGQLTVTKQKDGEDGSKITYRLAVTPLSAIDPNRTSLVVIPVEQDEIAPKAKKKALSLQQKLVFDALQKVVDQEGRIVDLPNVPHDRRCVKVDSWRHAYYAMSPAEYDTKQKAFKRASEALLANRTIGFWDNYAWITDS